MARVKPFQLHQFAFEEGIQVHAVQLSRILCTLDE